MMKERNRKGRLRILALAAALAAMPMEGLPLARAPVVYAAENQASAMQLAKTEGTVKIKSGSDRNVPLREDLRLYNGYRVATTEKSYAWIELDRVKMAKLDAVSDASIRKNGKKLEILVNSGNIFFNVTEPLKDDESLNIRTATMVAGIRGTSGWVEITDEKDMKISVLEGKVELNVTDPVTGQSVEGTVSGGETAICSISAQAAEGGKCEIQRETLKQEDINGFILQEVATDPALAEKILEKGGMDLRNVTVEEAQARLTADEEKVQKKIEEVQVALSEQSANVSAGTVWAETPAEPPAAVAPVVTQAPEPVTPVVTTPVEPEDTSYQVTFDTQGGSTIPDQVVAEGDRAGEPVLPARPGYNFTGWYTDVACTANYDFSRRVTRALTLYAGWDIQSYAVNFDAKGGTAVLAQTVEYSSRATLPAEPTRTGHRFTGWFTDEAYTHRYDFARAVTGNLTLYAGWEKLSYTVTFDTQGGNTIQSQTVQYGSLVSKPGDPTRTEHTFTGWYTDNTCTQPYTFNATATVTGDITLYAGWRVTLDLDRSDVTMERVNRALADRSVNEVILSGNTTGSLTVDRILTLTIPAGKTLKIGTTMTNKATIVVRGTLTCTGNIITNSGTINVESGGAVSVGDGAGSGRIENPGIITNHGTINATLNLGSNGTLENYGTVNGGTNSALLMEGRGVKISLYEGSFLRSNTPGASTGTVEYIGIESIDGTGGTIENAGAGPALIWKIPLSSYEGVTWNGQNREDLKGMRLRTKTRNVTQCVPVVSVPVTEEDHAPFGWMLPEEGEHDSDGWYTLKERPWPETPTALSEESALATLAENSALAAWSYEPEQDVATDEPEETSLTDTTKPAAQENTTESAVVQGKTEGSSSTDATNSVVQDNTTESTEQQRETGADTSTDTTKSVASEKAAEETAQTGESDQGSPPNETEPGGTDSSTEGDVVSDPK